MGIAGFLNLFGKQKNKLCATPIVIDSLIGEITIREAAFHACVNLIANAIANCSIKQFKNGKPVKDREWYLLNYQPNINHNATAFWQKLIHRLFEDNEALVVEVNKNLYVADAFVKNDLQALHPHTYQGVMIDNLLFDKTFSEEDVWYFKLHDADIKLLSDQVANLYAKLIQAFTNAYVSSKGSKGILYIDQIAERDYNDRFSAIAGETFKSFYENPNAIVPLFEGYKYEQVQNESAPVGDPSQMRSQVEAIFETYAMAFGIPKAIA